MRSDYALLSRAQIQSTSDQQDFRRYPPIAAAAPASIAPEQAASWAYPQPEFTADEIAFTLCGALLGRVHLSGHLNRMDPGQRALVADAIAVYKWIRSDIATATPFWPLGLPGWDDPWLALGLRGADVSYAAVWHRDGAEDSSRTLSVPHLRGRTVTPQVLYPEGTADEVSWDADRGELSLRLPRATTACLVALSV
jgi:alpha-galactosidase